MVGGLKSLIEDSENKTGEKFFHGTCRIMNRMNYKTDFERETD